MALAVSELPAHKHAFGGQYLASGFGPFGAVAVSGGGSNNVPTIATVNSVTETANSGGGDGHTNMQPYLAANWLIKL